MTSSRFFFNLRFCFTNISLKLSKHGNFSIISSINNWFFLFGYYTIIIYIILWDCYYLFVSLLYSIFILFFYLYSLFLLLNLVYLQSNHFLWIIFIYFSFFLLFLLIFLFFFIIFIIQLLFTIISNHFLWI